ncbi:hypothetical protein CRG98_015655 [Punica granatum]|uniref:Uncharacterized protein n=1 Tax=Punica granatum TaxID=22663 RepID=A0A2I0K607_PUNGR|nr:hypothetical protein CRG98_015655 [Punica granatum]
MEDVSDLGGGIGVANWGPQLQIDRGLRVRGHQYPRRTPTTLVEGSGSPIGSPDPELTKDSKSKVPGRFWIEAVSESSIDSRLGPPIGDADPSTEVTGVLRGNLRLQIGHLNPSFPFDFLYRTKMKQNKKLRI